MVLSAAQLGQEIDKLMNDRIHIPTTEEGKTRIIVSRKGHVIRAARATGHYVQLKTTTFEIVNWMNQEIARGMRVDSSVLGKKFPTGAGTPCRFSIAGGILVALGVAECRKAETGNAHYYCAKGVSVKVFGPDAVLLRIDAGSSGQKDVSTAHDRYLIEAHREGHSGNFPLT